MYLNFQKYDINNERGLLFAFFKFSRNSNAWFILINIISRIYCNEYIERLKARRKRTYVEWICKLFFGEHELLNVTYRSPPRKMTQFKSTTFYEEDKSRFACFYYKIKL